MQKEPLPLVGEAARTDNLKFIFLPLNLMARVLVRPELKGGATVNGVEVIDADGNITADIKDTLASGKIYVGNSSNVTSEVTPSGDVSMTNAGVFTVTGATGAFNVGTNLTFAKEVNHIIRVTTSTTANTAGATLDVVGGAGVGTGNGGAASLVGGASGAGATGNGGAANVTGGAALSTNGNGGSVVLTGGAKTGTGVAGGVRLESIVLRTQAAPTAKTTSGLLTAAEVVVGMITVNQGAGASSAQQLPTGTNLAAALPADMATGDSFDVSVINISTVDAEDASITTNTDLTLVGNMDFQAHNALASQGSSGILRFRKTGATTFTVYRIA